MHAACDGQGRPLVMLLTERQTCDYDADRFGNALIAKGIAPCIPSKSNRNIPIPHDRTLYR